MVDALKSFSNNNSPGNDGLTKEFYKAFWSELKEPFMNSNSQSKISKKTYYFTKASFYKVNCKGR